MTSVEHILQEADKLTPTERSTLIRNLSTTHVHLTLTAFGNNFVFELPTELKRNPHTLGDLLNYLKDNGGPVGNIYSDDYEPVDAETPLQDLMDEDGDIFLKLYPIRK